MLSKLAAALAFTLTASLAHADDFYVYFLAGQSNMDGYGYVNELPESLTGEVEGVRIFLGQIKNDALPVTGTGVWTPLMPGFGVGSRTDGQTVSHSNRFGPELTFAAHLRELRPNENIAIIKYARGGSSLDVRRPPSGTWDPHDNRGEGELQGVNQYDHALATIANATSTQDIDGDGEPDTLIPAGILWMQGETDATSKETADDYADNLAEIAELFRAALRKDNLPFVIGLISDSGQGQGEQGRVWAFGDIVRDAQQHVANEDPHAEVVTSTDNYNYSDPYHYDTEGYIDLGKQFAEAIDSLKSEEK
jgi:hypothetical protein